VGRRVKRAAVRRTFRRRGAPSTKIYNFKRVCELDNFNTTEAVSPAFGAYQFKLADCPNSAEFTTLFDQYRIRAVKITFYPVSNVAWTGSASTSMPIGEFYSLLDYDDATIPTAIADMNQYSTIRRTYFNRPHSRYFKPTATQVGVYESGGATNGYRTLPTSTWFDCSSNTILYYGLKCAYAVSNAASMQKENIRVTATYYMQFRRTR